MNENGKVYCKGLIIVNMINDGLFMTIITWIYWDQSFRHLLKTKIHLKVL